MVVGIDPDGALEVSGEAVQPGDTRCRRRVVRIDAAMRLEELRRMHRRVADDRELPALVEAAQEIARRYRVGARQPGAAIDVIVDAVVKIVRLEIAQTALLVQ